MKLFFATFIILLLAFSGYHLTFRRIRLPIFAQKFYLNGTEFLFLGLFLGPQFLNLLDADTCRGLAPFSALLLGWAGLLFGFQFELVILRRFPLEYLAAAATTAIWTLGIVLLGVSVFFSTILPRSDPMAIASALTLAAAAACTAQTGMALLEGASVARRPDTVRLLRYISSIDGLVSLTVFGLIFFFPPARLAPPGAEGAFTWLLTGAGLLFLYLLLLARRQETSELLLVVIGMAVITSGAAIALNFSPLVANFLLGACLINLTREKERIFQILINVEKPVYLLLLLFLGVDWRLDSPWSFILAAGLCACRFAGKWIGGATVTRLGRSFKDQPGHLGLGLLESGGLPLAILFDFQQHFSGALTGTVVSVSLLAVVFNNLISPHFLERLLKGNR